MGVSKGYTDVDLRMYVDVRAMGCVLSREYSFKDKSLMRILISHPITNPVPNSFTFDCKVEAVYIIKQRKMTIKI